MKYAGMPFGMWMLMKELGLYDLTPALCRLDYTMSEAGGVTDFARQYTLDSSYPNTSASTTTTVFKLKQN